MKPLPADVHAAFDGHATAQRKTLLKLRDLIFDVAQSDPRVGTIEEALRWGEPAYLTSQSKAGSTVRLGVEKASGQVAIFFNCKTTLVAEFRQQFGSALSYSKNRAVLIGDQQLPETALKMCIASALTYHLRKT